MDTISDDHWDRYRRQGYLRLGRVLDDAGLADVQRRIDNLMLDRLPTAGLTMQLDGGGAYDQLGAHTPGSKGARLDYRKIEGLEHDDVFARFMRRPLFRRICAEQYGAHCAIAAYRAMFMNKPAHKGTVLPWHQDGGEGWGLDRDPLVTVWTALDPATIANGCVQVIPGSHRLGLLSARGHTITPDQEREHCPERQIEFLELGPGEAVLLHNWLLHRSDVNRTAIPRRAFSVCYMDARTRHAASGAAFPVIFAGSLAEATAPSLASSSSREHP